MNILVTAGNTQTPIDQVRCITNIFSGRTGGRIALTAWERGHTVTHFTSHPEVIAELTGKGQPTERWRLRQYRTFDELHHLMAEAIPSGGFDVIIHAAAVSDYSLAGVYAPAEDATFDAETGIWSGSGLKDVQAGKVKSHFPELWLRLVPTQKLVDLIREPWGFRGKLVKFKLEVSVTEHELEQIAERSRVQSRADWMVANTLEGKDSWALIGSGPGAYRKITRTELPSSVLDAVEG